MQTSQKNVKLSNFIIINIYPYKLFIFVKLYLPLSLSWQRSLYIETSPFVCRANQWTGFCMSRTSIMKELMDYAIEANRCQFLLLSVSDKMVARRVSTFWVFRGSRSQIFFKTNQRCSVRKSVLKNFANFTGKHLCWCPVLNKVEGLQDFRLATILKRDSNRGIFKWNCYEMNFILMKWISFLWNDLEHIFLQNTSDGCFWV